MKDKIRKIPVPVVQRLTKYLVHVRWLCEADMTWASSERIAHALGLTSSTVRQDLSYLDISGISKRGYETMKLEAVLRCALGANKINRVVIVGAGNLGRALALHAEFARRGFVVFAIFDSNSRLIGRRIGKVAVRAMHELGRIVRKEKVDIGIIAVPASSAQAAADALIANNVRGLLNLTAAYVRVPPRVTVVDARIVASLQELAYLMKVNKSGPKAGLKA